MNLKDVKIDDRPRERLKNVGINSLSNNELMSILLRCGTKNKSVIDLSNEVLNLIYNDKEVTINELLKIKGIGISKATIILSALELGKRVNNVKISKKKFITPIDVFNYFKDLIGNLKQENLYAIYLDVKGYLIDYKLITIGGINNIFVDFNSIFKWAYKLSSTAIILVHNHPSLDPTPSSNDILVTKELINKAKLLNFVILDHIIIGKTYFSMTQQNII